MANAASRRCSFEAWYDAFAPYTFPSRIIPLSEDFVRYLQSDGIQLPAPPQGVSTNDLPARDPRSTRRRQHPSYADEDEDDDDDEEEGSSQWCFPELERAISAAITELGGEVLPKLNWTCPRDASWMTMGTLDCGTPGEVFLLLKSSDFVQRDLGELAAMTTPAMLVLRQWKKQWNPALEFRCVVRGGKLRAVCQRDAAEFFPFLLDGDFQAKLLARIQAFADNVVVPKFEDPTGDFVFDVYAAPQRVWLVDFAPLLEEEEAEGSDDGPHALLSWQELRELYSAKLVVVRDAQSRDMGEQRALAMHRVPLDLVEGLLAADFFQGKPSSSSAKQDAETM